MRPLPHFPLMALTSLALAAASPAAAQKYHVAKKIPVGTEGGWDYTLADAAGHRLYVSHGTRAVVIDLDRDSVIGEVTPANGIHGIAVAAEFGRGFTSNGRDTTVTIFDLKTLATIGSVRVTGANPDPITYDDASKRIFTLNGGGQNATAIDPAKGEVIGTVPLGGRPEFAQPDGKGTVYVNIESTGEIVAFDARKLAVTKRYPLTGCEEPSGLAIDRARTRLFSVCRNKVMVVTDPVAGRVVATLPIGQGVDAAGYDPETRLAFASNGEGTLTVVKQEGPDTYSVLETVPTQRGSRTMALDTRTHRVYLASAEFGPPPAPATPGGRPGRAPMVPGSFAILVLEP